ncbi:MAG: mechanosensitive ion channel family protein [Acidobacteriota bacterium]|nr:mechanosensitive ion channel family protein [Acidobacteriota bacterium]
MRAESWIPWIARGLRVVVIVGGAWLLTFLARRLLRRFRTYAMRAMRSHGHSPEIELEKRAATIMAALGKLASLAIWMVALVMALNELTFNIQPLLAGIGVAGLALGLGAQTLIKDWLGGLLVLLEDQIRIGDAVTINGISGVVEEINLRTTVLRSENGAVNIIANGLINTLSNMTREYAYYVFEATLAHGADVDRVLRILGETGAEVAGEAPYKELILAPIEVLGADRFVERGVMVRARIKTLPSRQALVGREFNRLVNARLAAEGISFPPVT